MPPTPPILFPNHGLDALARAPGSDLVSRTDPLSIPAAYLLRRNRESQAAMRYSLEAIVRCVTGAGARAPVDVEAFPWHELRADHVAGIRRALEGAEIAPTTANRHLAALRGVLDEMFDRGAIGADDRLRCRRAARSFSAEEAEPAGRMLSPEEVRAMSEHARCARDRAIVVLAVYTGLRREELSRLDLEHVDLEVRAVTVARGKGRKRRVVDLWDVASSALEQWISERGNSPGAFFWRRAPGGQYLPGRRLSKSGVWSVITGLARSCGIEVTPHDLRRTYASTSLEHGVDLATVQKLMGHSDPRTTSRYDRRDEKARRDAAKKLDGVF